MTYLRQEGMKGIEGEAAQQPQYLSQGSENGQKFVHNDIKIMSQTLIASDILLILMCSTQEETRDELKDRFQRGGGPPTRQQENELRRTLSNETLQDGVPRNLSLTGTSCFEKYFR